MSIAQTPPRGVNPGQSPSQHPTVSAVFATLQAAAQDVQVTRAGLAVLIWMATESNAWRRFTVTRLASPEMLNLTRKTINRALGVLIERGFLEERAVRGHPGEREARLIVVGAPGGAQ